MTAASHGPFPLQEAISWNLLPMSRRYVEAVKIANWTFAKIAEIRRKTIYYFFTTFPPIWVET
jgi:hypothetical protein